MSTLFRKISIVLGLIVLAGAGYLAKSLSQKKAPPKKKEVSAVVIREVEVIAVKNSEVSSKLAIQGSLEAYHKVDIFAEVTGMLPNTTRVLKAGNYIKKGAILLNIDKEEAQLNILSQKSNLLNAITQLMPNLKIDYPESFQQWKTYLDNFDVEQSVKVFPSPLNDQEKYFIASKNILSQYYTIKSAENRLQKYTVYAPFSGVITQSNINPGSLVRVGQKMGELMGTGVYEMKATVNLTDLKFIKLGNKVSLYSESMEGSWRGTVKRISDQIDPNTQSVVIFISVNNRNLREGMYLRGTLNSRSIKNAIKIPIELLVNQNQVYIVNNGKLVLQKIEVENKSANHAIIKGLADETLLLKEKIIGAYEGLKVKAIIEGN